MAIYSFRTDDYDENNLELLTKKHGIYKGKRNTILRAALEAFSCLDSDLQEKYLQRIRSRDSRRVQLYGK